MNGTSSFSLIRSARQDRSVLGAKVDRATWRRVAGYATKYRWQLGALLVVIVASSASVVASAFVLKRLIDEGVTPGDRGVILAMAGVLVVLTVADGLLQLVQRWITVTIGEGIIVDLRRAVFAHIQRQPIMFFTHARTGALVTRVNTDVVGAQQAFATALTNLVGNSILVAGVLSAMVVLSWQITLGALALVPLFLIPSRLVGRRLQDLSRRRMEVNAQLGNRMTERFSVAGALLVKLYGRRGEENEQFGVRAEKVARLGVQSAMVNRFFFTALATVAGLATALVYGVGGVLTLSGSLTVGALLSLAALLTRLYTPITALAGVRLDVMTAMVSFERVFEVLDLEPLVRDRADAVALPGGPVSFEFESVSFSYPAAGEVSLGDVPVGESAVVPAQVLSDVSFEVPAGATVALVGPSGAGKTTCANLLLRLADPTSGVVRVNGRDVREVQGDSLRQVVGLVPQDAHLFNETIRENLAYAKPGATSQEMMAALADAQVADVVAALPDGLDTVVGDRGHRLSGGQKQRLAIARLLLKDPAVVVLDEATAHLDSESEAAVHRAFSDAVHDRTAVVIAHRLSTIRSADVIVVLVAGRVAQLGSHEELLAQGGVYQQLYSTQFES